MQSDSSEERREHPSSETAERHGQAPAENARIRKNRSGIIAFGLCRSYSGGTHTGDR